MRLAVRIGTPLAIALVGASLATALPANADKTPPAQAEATAAEQTPLDFTRSVLGQTRTIIDSELSHNDQLAALYELLKNFLDTDTMGRAALANHWSKLTSSQQAEFLQLFRDLFQRTYVQKLLLFDRPDFEYVGQQEVDDYVRVDTLILTRKDEFAVTYRFRRLDDGWRASDIQIEDLSLTKNFRRQLDRLLSKSSIENVLGRMRRKYGSGKESDDASAENEL